MYHIETVTNPKKLWRKQRHHFRVRHYGDIILTSETYYNLDDCKAVADHLHRAIKNSTLKHIDL